jgi:hypothetical protein
MRKITHQIRVLNPGLYQCVEVHETPVCHLRVTNPVRAHPSSSTPSARSANVANAASVR